MFGFGGCIKTQTSLGVKFDLAVKLVHVDAIVFIVSMNAFNHLVVIQVEIQFWINYLTWCQ